MIEKLREEYEVDNHVSLKLKLDFLSLKEFSLIPCSDFILPCTFRDFLLGGQKYQY